VVESMLARSLDEVRADVATIWGSGAALKVFSYLQ
jgi:hypothetical protein